MAAPNETVWGAIVNDYGRIGLYITTSDTTTQRTITIQVWFWSKYSVADNMGNALYLDDLSTTGSATTSKGGTNIQTTVDTGAGWSTSNQVLLTGTSYTYTHARGTSAATRYIYAKLTDVGRVGETMYVEKTVSIPALEYTACKEPTSVVLSPEVYEDGLTITWSGATGGTNNPIAGYECQIRVKPPGGDWGTWLASSITESGTMAHPTVQHGGYVQYRVKALGTAGSSYDSGWTESNIVQKIPYTICKAPTTFLASPGVAENAVTISWNGASGGTNNAIVGYDIQYALSNDGVTFGNWQYDPDYDIAHPTASPVNDPINFDRGWYIKYRIRTRGSAGENYYSDWKESNTVRRNPYTACKAPTSYKLSPEIAENSITHEWAGASGGSNNAITGYEIEYALSDDGITFNSWSHDSDPSVAYPKQSPVDDPIFFNRGRYLKCRIRTLGSAGENYYSDWKESNTVRRNPYTACKAPSSITLSPSIYEESFSITWTTAQAGENNPVKGYKLQLRTRPPGGIWGGWRDSGITEPDSEAKADVDRGWSVQYRVKALATQGSAYDSGYTESNVVTKNICPTGPTTTTVDKAEYSPGETVALVWSGAADADNSIAAYDIFYSVSGSDEYVLDEMSLLTTVRMTAGYGRYEFTPSQADYLEYIHFAICATDSLGAKSNRVYMGCVLRNDNPYILVHDGEAPQRHLLTLCVSSDGNTTEADFAKFMPYIYDGTTWNRYTDL